MGMILGVALGVLSLLALVVVVSSWIDRSAD
jgi:hypothetical protein